MFTLVLLDGIPEDFFEIPIIYSRKLHFNNSRTAVATGAVAQGTVILVKL